MLLPLVALLLVQTPESLEWFRKGEALIGTPDEYSEKQSEYFAKAVAADPGFSAARFNLGLVLLTRSSFDLALVQFTSFSELEPENPAGFLMKARCHIELGNTQAVTVDLELALRLDPENWEAWEILGRSFYEMKEFERALQAFEKARGSGQAGPEIHYELALALLALDKTESALRELDSYVELAPESYEGHLQLGLTLLRTGNKERALSALLAAERIDPDDPNLAQSLGDLLLDLGREEEAAVRLARADQDSAANLANQGIIAARQQKWVEAEELLRRSLAKEPFEPLIWGHLADVLMEQKKAMEALAAYEQALRYAPEDFQSLINAGSIAADNDRAERARGHFERALLIRPTDGSVHYKLAVVLDRLGLDPERVQSLYLEALEMGENEAFAHFRLAYMFAAQAQPTQALEHLEAALQGNAERFHPVIMDELRKVRSALDSIRYSPLFSELMAKYEPKTPGE